MSLNILLKGQLRYLNEFYEVTAISGTGPDLDEVQKREGVRVHTLEMEREIAPVRDLIALLKLYRYFKKEKPHIVHSITPKAGLLSMLAARLAGVPVRMHTFTGLIFPSKKGLFKWLLLWMDRILANSATHLYPEGKGVKEDLLTYRITRKPLKILSHGNVNGIDTTYFHPAQFSLGTEEKLRADLGLTPADFVFIFVGRLVRDKGINELIAAFKKLGRTVMEELGQKHPKLLLVGPLEHDLDPLEAATLEEMKNNPHIITVGFQEEVRPYFKISQALVFPSYREGFPNVVLQSLALELPAIVTDINGSNEIVIQGENGLIIPPQNEFALQEAMYRLYNDEEFYLRLKKNTRASIFPFEQKEVWAALLAEYESVLSNN